MDLKEIVVPVEILAQWGKLSLPGVVSQPCNQLGFFTLKSDVCYVHLNNKRSDSKKCSEQFISALCGPLYSNVSSVYWWNSPAHSPARADVFCGLCFTRRRRRLLSQAIRTLVFRKKFSLSTLRVGRYQHQIFDIIDISIPWKSILAKNIDSFDTFCYSSRDHLKWEVARIFRGIFWIKYIFNKLKPNFVIPRICWGFFSFWKITVSLLLSRPLEDLCSIYIQAGPESEEKYLVANYSAANTCIKFRQPFTSQIRYLKLNIRRAFTK